MPAQLVAQLAVSFTSASKVLVLLLLTEVPNVAPAEVDRVNHGSEAMWLQKPLWCGQAEPGPWHTGEAAAGQHGVYAKQLPQLKPNN